MLLFQPLSPFVLFDNRFVCHCHSGILLFYFLFVLRLLHAHKSRTWTDAQHYFLKPHCFLQFFHNHHKNTHLSILAQPLFAQPPFPSDDFLSTLLALSNFSQLFFCCCCDTTRNFLCHWQASFRATTSNKAITQSDFDFPFSFYAFDTFVSRSFTFFSLSVALPSICLPIICILSEELL